MSADHAADETGPQAGSLFELVLLVPEAAVEPVGEALDALDALSTSVEDADAMTEAEQALFGEPGMPPPKEGWQRSRVVALFGTEAAAREALEETGLTLRVGALLGVWDWQFGDETTGKQGIVLLFRGEIEAGVVHAADDMTELGWFDPDALPPLAFPSDEDVIKQACGGEGAA